VSRIIAAAALGVVVVLVPAASALTVPPVTVASVTVPTVTVPAVTTPPVSTPVATVPSVNVPGRTVPGTTVPSATVPRAPVAPGPVPAPAPPSRPQPSPQVPAPTVPTRSSPATDVYSYPASSSEPRSGAARSTGTRASRTVRATAFHLARPATVRVTVWQEAPRCRLFGRFRVAGARGANTLRLPKRLAHHRLVVGTYGLVGLARGREVIDEQVRVERTKSGRLRVRKAELLADVCLAAPESLSAAAVFPLGSAGPGARSGPASTSGIRGATKSSGPRREAAGPGSTKAAGPELSPAVKHTLLFVLLALAIALLAVSSLPESVVRHGATGAALARHRAALTSAGLAMIVAAALAAALG